MLKPHDLRHGVAMEIYEQHHDLEEVRSLLGHTRLAMDFCEAKAVDVLSSKEGEPEDGGCVFESRQPQDWNSAGLYVPLR